MAAKTVSFTSINLHNLNEPRLPMYQKTEGWTQAEVVFKTQWVASMLKRACAEVFGFQELWHTQSLINAFSASGLADQYEVLAPPGHCGSGIVCAGAVRKGLLIGDPEWISDFPESFHLQSKGEDKQTSAIFVDINKFSRPVLHFRIQTRKDVDPVHVFVCHFKSKGPTTIYNDGWYRKNSALYSQHRTAIGAALSTIRRTAEAMAMRLILTSVMKGNHLPVVLLGDLNDGHNSNTLDILTEQPVYLRPTSKGGRDTALYSGQSLQQLRSQRDVYYTHVWQDIHGSLDHILVSEEFYDNSRNRVWVFDGLDIFNDHLNSEDCQKSEGATDHGVVRARFSYKRA